MIYHWDAENRLQSMHPERTGPGGTPLQDDLWVSFTYDWRGRRVRKLIEAYDVSHEWYTVADLRYLYDLPGTSGGREAPSTGEASPLVQGEWNLLVEFEASGEEPFVLRRYTWGLDLAGQNGDNTSDPSRDREGVVPGLHAAGGIGGLLAMEYPSGNEDHPSDPARYIYFYDANGNVSDLIDVSMDPYEPLGATAGHYEYDPYGNSLPISITGLPDPANPFRFSTKYQDAEFADAGLGVADLYYYGYRYYSPLWGRWLNRDPIGVRAGWSLVAFVQNNPNNVSDLHGLMNWAPAGPGEHEFFFDYTRKQRAAWYAEFDQTYGSHISRAARNYCIPRRLLNLIVMVEGIDWTNTKRAAEQTRVADTYGPAQVYRGLLSKHPDCINKKKFDEAKELAILIGTTRATQDGSDIATPDFPDAVYLEGAGNNIEFTACLLSKFLDELCRRAKDGKSSTVLTQDLAPGCNIDSFCCKTGPDGKPKPCIDVYQTQIPRCLIRIMAAIWNNGFAYTELQYDPNGRGNVLKPNDEKADGHGEAAGLLWDERYGPRPSR